MVVDLIIRVVIGSAIDQAIKRLRAKQAESTVIDPQELAKMELRVSRLQEFQGWMQEDPALAQFIDTAIKKRVWASTRIQVVISFIVAVVFLIAGWLLNALSPVNFLNLFHH